MRGRKPKPTFLKLVKGTSRKSRANESEPKPDLALPKRPKHLTPEARAEWRMVCEELYQAGILTRIDRAVLAAYCQAYGRWVQAESALRRMAEEELAILTRAGRAGEATGALFLKTTNGNTVQNPLVGTANKAMADMVRYAAELGMTPSARSRVHAQAREKESDPAARYLT